MARSRADGIGPIAPRIEPVRAPDAEQRALLATTLPRADGGPLNLFATLAHAPRLARRVSALGGYFSVHAAIAPRDRELVVLRTAARVESDYEVAHHRVIGAAAGLTAEEIEAAVDPALPHPWTPADRALLDLADELIATHRISDATWSGLAGRAEAERIELVVLAGTYALLGGVLNGLGVELDASPPAT